MNAVLRAMEVAGFLGSDLVVVHGPGTLGESGPEAIEHFMQSLLSLHEASSRTNVRVGLENVMTPDSSVQSLVSILNEFHSDRIGLCVDVGHLNIEGDVIDGLERSRNWLLSVHISDNHGSSDEHLVPGKGEIDWPRVVEILEMMPRLNHRVLEVQSWNAGASPSDPVVQECLTALARCWRTFFKEAG